MAQKHSRVTAAGRLVWFTERLWYEARDLPVRQVPIAEIKEFNQDCWFGRTPPTCRAVAEHARRIFEADLQYPIILSAEGYLMDGGHRIAKAFLLQLDHVPAVQFSHDPEPDYVVPPDALTPHSGSQARHPSPNLGEGTAEGRGEGTAEGRGEGQGMRASVRQARRW